MLLAAAAERLHTPLPACPLLLPPVQERSLLGRLGQTVPKVRCQLPGGCWCGRLEEGPQGYLHLLLQLPPVCIGWQPLQPKLEPFETVPAAAAFGRPRGPVSVHLPAPAGLPRVRPSLAACARSSRLQVLNVGLLVSALFHILELGSLLVESGVAVSPLQGGAGAGTCRGFYLAGDQQIFVLRVAHVCFRVLPAATTFCSQSLADSGAVPEAVPAEGGPMGAAEPDRCCLPLEHCPTDVADTQEFL